MRTGGLRPVEPHFGAPGSLVGSRCRLPRPWRRSHEHRTGIWLLLLFASAGVFHHAGIKIPYFAFFAHDRGYRVSAPPANMRVAVALAAVIRIGIGIAVSPGPFHDLLPHEMDYAPCTTAHVIQLQLLLFAALAFTVLVRTGLYPPEIRSVNLDVYRKTLPAAWGALTRSRAAAGQWLSPPLRRQAGRYRAHLARALGPDGRIGTPWSTHVMVWWLALLLGLVLLLALL